MSVTQKLYEALYGGWEKLDPIGREEFDAIVWNAIKEEVTMSDHIQAAKVVQKFDSPHSNMIDVVAQGLADARRNEREVMITNLKELLASLTSEVS